MQVDVYDPLLEQVIAKLYLNGHSIAAGGPLGKSGAMRSFSLVQGSLIDQWDVQRSLVLRGEDGAEANIRIAALPAEEGETGFIEFL